MPAEVREQALAKIDDLFRSSPEGLAVPAVRELVKEVTALIPIMLCALRGGGLITRSSMHRHNLDCSPIMRKRS